jgi:hypothetical protein
VPQNLLADFQSENLRPNLVPPRSQLGLIPTLKANPTSAVEAKIHQLAAAGVPVTQFLNPFLTEIAEGRIKMVPQAQQQAR